MTQTDSEMKLTALAPWFGGKRTLAPRVVEQLGGHASYFEPFCGSMAVLFAKPPCQQETVCDLHGELTNLAVVLAREGTAVELYDRLVRTLFCDRLLEQARARLETIGHDEQPSVERAYWFFVHCWCARNGTAGSARMNFQLAVRFTPNGGSATTRFRNAVDSIPAWHERLRSVVILNRDAFDVIPRIADQKGVAVYCDPPYLLSTRNGDGDGGYLHDFDEAPPDSDSGGGRGLFGERKPKDKHERLADLLAGFKKARVVVSYYAHRRLLSMYPPPRWTHVAHYRQKNLRRQMKAGHRPDEAPEVLIMNGPEYTP